MRRIASKKPEQKAIITIHSQKIERREKRREVKAEAAARLEKSIEKELLDRLEIGVYGDMYNIVPSVFEKVIENTVADADQMQEDEEIEYEEDEEEEQEEEEEETFERDDELLQYSDDNLNMECEDQEIEESDLTVLFPRKQQKLAAPVVHIEYERHEDLEQDEKNREKIPLSSGKSKNKS